MVKEFKDWLFVQVPKDAKWLGVDYNKKHLYYSTEQDRDLLIILPPGSWQIIGKGDGIDWEGIVEASDPFEDGDNNWIRYNKNESGVWEKELGNKLLVKELIENGWTDVEYLSEGQPAQE